MSKTTGNEKLTLAYLKALAIVDDDSTEQEIVDCILSATLHDHFWSDYQGVFTNILTNASTADNNTVNSDENRAKFSIAVQFYIGCISLHYYEKYGKKLNLGRIFDEHRDTAKAFLSEAIQLAIYQNQGDTNQNQGDTIEENIALVVNILIKDHNQILDGNSSTNPRLTRLTADDIGAIRKNFKMNYNTIKESRHLDEFFFLLDKKDTEINGQFVRFQTNFCLPLSTALFHHNQALYNQHFGDELAVVADNQQVFAHEVNLNETIHHQEQPIVSLQPRAPLQRNITPAFEIPKALKDEFVINAYIYRTEIYTHYLHHLCNRVFSFMQHRTIGDLDKDTKATIVEILKDYSAGDNDKVAYIKNFIPSEIEETLNTEIWNIVAYARYSDGRFRRLKYNICYDKPLSFLTHDEGLQNFSSKTEFLYYIQHVSGASKAIVPLVENLVLSFNELPTPPVYPATENSNIALLRESMEKLYYITNNYIDPKTNTMHYMDDHCYLLMKECFEHIPDINVAELPESLRGDKFQNIKNLLYQITLFATHDSLKERSEINHHADINQLAKFQVENHDINITHTSDCQVGEASGIPEIDCSRYTCNSFSKTKDNSNHNGDIAYVQSMPINNTENAVKIAYNNVKRNITSSRSELKSSGTTVNIVASDGNQITCANLGDTRLVMLIKDQNNNFTSVDITEMHSMLHHRKAGATENIMFDGHCIRDHNGVNTHGIDVNKDGVLNDVQPDLCTFRISDILAHIKKQNSQFDGTDVSTSLIQASDGVLFNTDYQAVLKKRESQQGAFEAVTIDSVKENRFLFRENNSLGKISDIASNYHSSKQGLQGFAEYLVKSSREHDDKTVNVIENAQEKYFSAVLDTHVGGEVEQAAQKTTKIVSEARKGLIPAITIDPYSYKQLKSNDDKYQINSGIPVNIGVDGQYIITDQKANLELLQLNCISTSSIKECQNDKWFSFGRSTGGVSNDFSIISSNSLSRHSFDIKKCSDGAVKIKIFQSGYYLYNSLGRAEEEVNLEKNKIVALGTSCYIKYDGQNILLYQAGQNIQKIPTDDIPNQTYSILSQMENIPMNGEKLHCIKTEPNSSLPPMVGFLHKATNSQIRFVPFSEGLERLQPLAPRPPAAAKPTVAPQRRVAAKPTVAQPAPQPAAKPTVTRR